MHILHGTWSSEKKHFVLWGEDTTRRFTHLKGRVSRLSYHPFQLSVDNLLRYLDRFTIDSKPGGDLVIIWLPGHQKHVQPSPEAQSAGMTPVDAEMALEGWLIDAVTLHPTNMLDLMLQIPRESRGFTLGSDLVFWQQAALLVMNCLVEGQYIPALEKVGNRYLAYWQARPNPDLMAQLAANMPPLCRALTDSYKNAPSAHLLLEKFLTDALNAFIRDQTHQKPRHAWLKALISQDVYVKDPDIAKLYDSWEIWQVAGTGITGTFRVCFRLHEPVEGLDDWSLDYLLQATDDPSLIIEADKVWATKGNRLDYLERRFDRPQEKLLAALGLAARIFEPIERSLRSTKPVGVVLSREEAYRFLVEALPILEATRFSVLVPNWWARRAKLKARVKMKAQQNEATGFLAAETLVNYNWELSLGGEAISRQEFEELVALKQPLVHYRDKWVALDPDHIQSALRFFDENESGELSLLDAFKISEDPKTAELDGVEVESTYIEGWLQEIFDQLRHPDNALIPPTPTGLNAVLRPYQQRGFGWLTQMRNSGLGACLADDMGLGKSIQTITYWLLGIETGKVNSPALVVCPTSVVGNWRHELQRFAPSLSIYRHQGADRLKGEKFTQKAKSVEVVLTSYALLHRDVETLQQIQWSSLVLDEAQNIKNPSTKQAQAARTLKADHRLALTGTPIENQLTELWSIFQFLNPGYLGSQNAFRSNFAIPIERYRDEYAATTLKKLTAPFILRRLKTDPNVIQDLPDKFENKVYCPLSPEQATLYEAVVREELEALDSAADEMARRGSILRMLTRLKQVCNHPAHFLKEGQAAIMENRSGKLNRLVEMLEEVCDVDERALIFTQYAEMGELLQAYLRECLVEEVLFLHGGTPIKQREEMIRSFQAPHGPAIFILSLKAGGTGLNLTYANHVFHFDRWYNPAVENQATDRAFRIGQTKNVQVHKYVCLGTLEERIDELIEHKQALADQIVGGGENWISELSNQELRELVALRHDAVEEL